MSVTDGRQLKAGRHIVGMTIEQMAEAASINRNSVLRVEAMETLPHFAYAAGKITKALEGMGLCFQSAEGKAGVFFPVATNKRCRNRYRTDRPEAQ